MKTNILKISAGVAVALALGCATPVFAKDATTFATILSSVPAPELPAKAAALVSQAAASEQKATVIAVVKAALKLNPVSAPAVVGAIAKVAPKMASVAASTAVSLQPIQAKAIILAATSGAPAESKNIALAISQEFPKDLLPNEYARVSDALSQIVPGFVQQAEPITRTEPNVTRTAVASAEFTEATAVQGPGPRVGGPFVPGGPNGVINRNQTIIVQPGSPRPYSRTN